MSYDEFVKRVNCKMKYGNIYHFDFESKPGHQLQEVNAWTYWQGIGVRHPRILVLGQDWGSTLTATKYFRAIDDMIINGIAGDDQVRYFKYIPEIETGGKDFYTDINLAKGFARLKHNGESIYPDVLHTRYQDLFFTNLIPGYRRNGKSTGGFKASWVTEQVKEDFKELIKILRPRVVLCLGKSTFEYAAKIYGEEKLLNGTRWNDYLDSDYNPIEIEKDPEKSTFLYPMPHPGYFGERNRSLSKMGKTIYDDWDRLGVWLESNQI